MASSNFFQKVLGLLINQTDEPNENSRYVGEQTSYEQAISKAGSPPSRDRVSGIQKGYHNPKVSKSSPLSENLFPKED